MNDNPVTEIDNPINDNPGKNNRQHDKLQPGIPNN